MIVEVYADIACPWCYVAMRRFKRALSALPGDGDVRVTLRPYQLDATLSRDPAEAFDATPHYEQRYGRDAYHEGMKKVIEAATGEGIDYHPERVVLTNTFAAHRLLWLAAQGADATLPLVLEERLFEAYHSHGRTVSDPETLVELAAGAGMDADRVRAFLAGEEGAAEVTQALTLAPQHNVTEVPTFFFDGEHRTSGAQPTSTYLELLEASAGAASGDDAPACNTVKP